MNKLALLVVAAYITLAAHGCGEGPCAPGSVAPGPSPAPLLCGTPGVMREETWECVRELLPKISEELALAEELLSKPAPSEDDTAHALILIRDSQELLEGAADLIEILEDGDRSYDR